VVSFTWGNVFMKRGIIAVLVAIVLVTGAVVLGRSTPPADGGPQKQSPTDPDVPKPGPVLAPVVLTIECEAYKEIADKAGEITLITVKQHSEGKPIKFLEVAGKEPFEKSGLDKKFKEDSLAGTLPGKVVYEFEVPRDDTYYLNLRAKWLDTCGNSVWARIDEGKFVFVEDENGKIEEKNYQWTWHQFVASGQPIPYALKKGKHTLTMALREHGMWLDKWIITTDANTPVDEN
jgi:hypothetical protein